MNTSKGKCFSYRSFYLRYQNFLLDFIPTNYNLLKFILGHKFWPWDTRLLLELTRFSWAGIKEIILTNCIQTAELILSSLILVSVPNYHNACELFFGSLRCLSFPLMVVLSEFNHWCVFPPLAQLKLTQLWNF